MIDHIHQAHRSALFDVSGRAYVITGAASGLGLAISQALIINGAQVLLVDLDPKRLVEVAAELDGGAGRANGTAVDVADAEGLRKAVDAFVSHTGRLDGLFANAGISGGPGFGTPAGASSGRLENQVATEWRRVLDVNMLGVVNSVQAAVPQMKRQGHGSVVITASIAGLHAEPFCSYVYAMAKAATIQLMRQSALELAPHDIRVNVIAPGFLAGTAIGGGRANDSQVQAALIPTIPLGRLGSPRDMQGVALLLASDAGRYLTGTVIPIDGGVLLGAPVSSSPAIRE
jgi:NAD(P)-dependent dehydrogenase (short-subunit alcohol dehydrogenase family)